MHCFTIFTLNVIHVTLMKIIKHNVRNKFMYPVAIFTMDV